MAGKKGSKHKSSSDKSEQRHDRHSDDRNDRRNRDQNDRNDRRERDDRDDRQDYGDGRDNGMRRTANKESKAKSSNKPQRVTREVDDEDADNDDRHEVPGAKGGGWAAKAPLPVSLSSATHCQLQVKHVAVCRIFFCFFIFFYSCAARFSWRGGTGRVRLRRVSGQVREGARHGPGEVCTTGSPAGSDYTLSCEQGQTRR